MTDARTFSAKAVARGAGALAIGVGGMVLVGWALDVVALKSILPGWVSVKPNTALAFVLTGIALLVSGQRAAWLARLCGWLAGLIGLLTLGEYVFGWNPGFDQWLFREVAGPVATSHPGRMAPDSALCFVLLAVGLETAHALRQRNRMLTGAVILGALVMTLGVAAISTYFAPAFGAFGWWGLTNMASPTAALFAVLGGALIAVAWQTGDLNWSLGLKTTAAYAGGLTLVVLLGLHTSRSALWHSETARRIERKEDVLNAINDVEAELAKAQAHTRGYVIAGEDRYLQSQQAAAGLCRAKLPTLRQLIVDPAQQARSARLEAQVNELLQWFSQVIAAAQPGRAATVRRDMVNHGEDLMDGVRALIAEMEAAERRMLQERHREAQDVARFTQVIITTGTLVSLIVFLSVLWGLNQSEKRQQQAAATLSASEVRYRRLFEAARDGVLILDAETGMVMDVNPYLIELLGVTREVFLGKKVWELGFFKDLAANEGNFAELKEKKYIRYEDMAMEGHDGQRHEVEFVSNVYLVNDQKVIQCNIRDISDRVRTAAALLASEANYRMLFREMINGFALHEIICDEAGNPSDYRFLAVNPAFERMTGLKAAETVGRTVSEILPDTERSWIEHYGKVALTGVPVCFENYAASMKKHFEVVAFRPTINQFACVFSDITVRKRAEEALLQSQQQLRALSALQATLREDERTRIAREIHDELGQLLTGLKMDLHFAEDLVADLQDARLHPLLDKLVAATELADATIITVQRIASELRPGVLDRLGLLMALHYEANQFERRSGLRCKLTLPEEEPAVSPEAATTFFRIFQETLTNVARHAAAKSVQGTFREDPGQWVLEVHDDGQGIAEAEATNPRSLGLLGMQERVRLLGGTVTVRRAATGGTVVEVRLPRHGDVPTIES